MSKTAILFPGQGAQNVGMGKDLAEAFPEVRDLFDARQRGAGL
jgi:[acyl-carrier-protein] S-malonyltransferase